MAGCPPVVWQRGHPRSAAGRVPCGARRPSASPSAPSTHALHAAALLCLLAEASSKPAPPLLWQDLDTAPGQSGSPIWENTPKGQYIRATHNAGGPYHRTIVKEYFDWIMQNRK